MKKQYILMAAIAVATLLGGCLRDTGSPLDDPDPPLEEGGEVSKGSGTQSDPYLISSKADMVALAEAVNSGTTYAGKYFRLTKSLTGSDALTTSVGVYNGNATTKSFNGVFDGNGCEIELNNAPYGVFANLYGATVQNLGVSGKVSASNLEISPIFTGGICGHAWRSKINYCYNTATVFGGSTGLIYVGGICGSAAVSTTITNCFNTGAVSASNSFFAGGISGDLSTNSNILNCYNTGNISATTSINSFAHAGGICGRTYSVASIKNCFSANASIVAKYSGSANSTDAGRIAGYTDSNTELSKNCALSTMTLNGSAVSSSDAAGKNGAGTSASNFKSQSWIQSNLGWDFNNVWKISANQYPVLRMSGN